MTNPIPPCPVCGTVPSAETYIRHPVIIPACKCITTQMQGPKEWVMVCESVLGRALRTHGIHTIQQLTDRLAPDPRVAVLESYGVSTADETACLIMLAARGSRTEIHTTEKLDDTLVLSVIKNLRSIGETQMFASLNRIAAQRGEG